MEPTPEMKTYLAHLSDLDNESKTDDFKLKAILKISENLDRIVLLPQYSLFLAKFMQIIKSILLNGPRQFISEYNIHQIRNVILTILYRLPSDKYLRLYSVDLIMIAFKLLETDNEENGFICLLIILQHQRMGKFTLKKEILPFLELLKKMYNEFTTNFVKVIQAKSSVTVKNHIDVRIEPTLINTFVTTAIHTNEKDCDNNLITYNLIPRVKSSLKFMQKACGFLHNFHLFNKQHIPETHPEIVQLMIQFITIRTCNAIPDCNREIFVEFVGVQVKCLMFIAYNMKDFMDIISPKITELSKGIVDLIGACPTEATFFRREIFAFFRYFTSSKFQINFLPHIDQLFDEERLFGSGYTTKETLRSFVCDVMGEFIHHVRLKISVSNLTKVVNFFIIILNDARSHANVANLLCKYLYSFIDCVRNQSEPLDLIQGKQILRKILAVFVLKLETIVEDVITIFANAESLTKTSQNWHQNIVEYKNIITWIISSVQKIVRLIFSIFGNESSDTLLISQFLKWGLQSLNLFTIGRLAMDAIPKKTNKLIQDHEAKLKEEKQLLENFTAIFILLDSSTFSKIFTSEIDFVVSQLIKNRNLIAIINCLLLSPGKSLIFGTILIECLLEKMDQVGSNPEASDLYVILFKTIFGSAALSSEENKKNLSASLQKIVKLSLDLAVNAKQPLNYFLILRALYRSIDSESQEIFCQEFLPLLFKLFLDLNRFQVESHRLEMQEILVELLLSIPVNISFLLPHLEKLMITTVQALNGSEYSISCGLKFLDLCINNLNFSNFRHFFQIVATDLLPSLYRIVRESSDDSSQKAFEILGKLGGENRKMLMNTQKLQFVDWEMNYPSIDVHFENSATVISFSVKEIIETAFSTLNSDADLFHKQQSWRVINSYLSATIKIEDNEKSLRDFLNYSKCKEEILQTTCYIEEDLAAMYVQKIALSGLFVAAAEKTSLDADQPVFETMLSYVRHYTMIFVAQQICSIPADPITKGPTKQKEAEKQMSTGQNPLVLVDALKFILKYGKTEFIKVASHILETIFNTASSIIGSLHRVCQLSFIEHLFRQMVSLCYENPWYSKLGGCTIIEFFIQKMSVKWLLIHLTPLIKGLIFVITDLDGGISFGTIDVATGNLEKLLRVCFDKTRPDPEIIFDPASENEISELDDLRKKAINEVSQEFVFHIISSSTILRKAVMKLLCLLAEIQQVTINEILEPHKEMLANVIPPIKQRMFLQPGDIQIGILDGNCFCLSLTPALFVLDPSVQGHQFFYTDLVHIIEKEDYQLAREPCYKDYLEFTPLKAKALRALTCFFSVKSLQGTVITTLINALKNPNLEIQETALECLKKLPSISQVSQTMTTRFLEPLQQTIESNIMFNLPFLTHFAYLTEIFPVNNDRFFHNLIMYLQMCLKTLKKEDSNIKFTDDIDQRLRKQLDDKIKEESEQNVTEVVTSTRESLETLIRQKAEEKRKHIATSKDIVQQILKIIQIFQKTSADFSGLIPQLCLLFLESEKELMNQISNPFRVPFAKALARYPSITVDHILHRNYIKNEEYGLFLEFLLTIKEGTVFKEVLENRSSRLIQLLLGPVQSDSPSTHEEKMEIRFRAVRIISILIDSNENWLIAQDHLVTIIKQIWYRHDFIKYHRDTENVKSSHLSEPKLLLKILIHYLKNNREDHDFLFNILNISRISFISHVTILSDFLETVAQTYDISWKRVAFSKFIGNFQNKKINEDLKSDILEYVVYKCFEASFKKGETLELLGAPPDPDFDDPQNLVPIFINKVIKINNPSSLCDRLRINIFRFACLLVKHASEYIHNTSKKSRGFKLRELICFAWPFLFSKNCVDPICRYHGHLLLSYIAEKFSVSKTIIIEVFSSLMRSYEPEIKDVVTEALDILIPIFPHRIENGYSKLAQLTKNVLIEVSHLVPSLCHCLQFVVKHFKVYYSVRHCLIPTLVNSINKLKFGAIDNKKLIIDIAEIIVEWEIQAKSEEANIIDVVGFETTKQEQFKRNVNKAPRFITMEPQSTKQVETFYVDKIFNIIFKLSCELNNVNTRQGVMDEQLVTRAANLVKRIFISDIWSQNRNFEFAWLKSALSGTDSEKIYKVLEFLIFLMQGLNEKATLYIFKNLESGLTLCSSSKDTTILKLTQQILIKLMAMFPIDPILSSVSREGEMKTLYNYVRKTVRDKFTTFKKKEESLIPCLMMAKVLYANNALYFDPLITNLVNVFQTVLKLRLAKTPSSRTEEIDLFTLLDILSSRIGIMSSNSREKFLTSLSVLIGSTSCATTIKSILKILKDWVEDNSENQDSIIKQKFPLFSKMLRRINKQFPGDLELKSSFLKIVELMSRNEKYQSATRLTLDLEIVFLEGLRSTQPEIRINFSSIANANVERTLKRRLEYIICSVNWEFMGSHYWIKQCIEYLLIIADPTTRIQVTKNNILLPSVKDLIQLILPDLNSNADLQEDNPNQDLLPNMDLANLDVNQELTSVDFDLNHFDIESPNVNSNQSNLEPESPSANVPDINPEFSELISKQVKFFEYLKNIRTEEFVSAAIHLCHMNTNLASSVWKDIFPKIWTGHVNTVPFVCDRIQPVHVDRQPSAIVTFCEALADCEPSILIIPKMMKSLGETYNMWHQMTLCIERMIDENVFKNEEINSPESNSQQEIFDSLEDMYRLLGEDDMWSGLWRKHVFIYEICDATALEQQGIMDEAQRMYSAVMNYRKDLDAKHITKKMETEFNECGKGWIRCAKELNQWQSLFNISKAESVNDPFLRSSLLEIYFQMSDWRTIRDYLDLFASSDLTWKSNLYRGYWSICGGRKNLKITDHYVAEASKSCIREWRRLPHIVGFTHIPLLHAAEEIIDLRDTICFHQNLNDADQLDKVNKVINTWKLRLPTIADDLSYWSKIFTWRELQYKSLMAFANSLPDQKMLEKYIHIWAESVNTVSKIARKQNIFSVALDSLTRIDKAKCVSLDDRFEKLKQKVKCYVKITSVGETKLIDALQLLESNVAQCFNNEIISDFYALKGKLYTLLGKSEEANSAFSSSIKMNKDNAKAWAFYGEYFEKVFQTDVNRIECAKLAVSCFLNTCKYSCEEKCRKYIAKILWFFNYDDEERHLFKLVNNHAMQIDPIVWVPWIPQLLKWMTRPPGGEMYDLINVISKAYPQAMFSQIRTLYMKFRFEKLEIHNHPTAENERNQENDKVLESLAKCAKIMSKLIVFHPTLMSYLDRTFEQISKLKGNWLQEILKNLQQILIMCYHVAFDSKENINEAAVTSKISSSLRKMVVNARHDLEKISNQNVNAQQNPMFQKMNKEFEQDFNLDDNSSKSFISLMRCLQKWIQILENETASSLRTILLEKKCQSLAYFNFEAAKIGLPGSTLFPKFSHYPVTIAKFTPRVDVIRHRYSIAHRVWILGSDGKLYSYLVATNDIFVDGSRNCRVLQLLQMLNLNLRKQKETSRRCLQFTIPNVVSFHPQMQLIEDNPNAITLLRIYKQICDRKKISLDEPIFKYYDSLSSIQAKGIGLSTKDLKTIFHEVTKSLVPKTILKHWAVMTFPSSADYWTFRKMFISQFSAIIFSQYVFHLTKLNPDMISLNPDSGTINVNYFTFDVNNILGKLDESVPFRLTPNIEEFVTEIGISGPLTESLIASARCLAHPSYQIKSILQAIIRDEIADDQAGATLVEKNKEIIRRVTEIVTSVSTRLNYVGDFTGIDSNVRKLLNNARNVDNLYQMDPFWYPWL